MGLSLESFPAGKYHGAGRTEHSERAEKLWNPAHPSLYAYFPFAFLYKNPKIVSAVPSWVPCAFPGNYQTWGWFETMGNCVLFSGSWSTSSTLPLWILIFTLRVKYCAFPFYKWGNWGRFNPSQGGGPQLPTYMSITWLPSLHTRNCLHPPLL